MYKKIPLATMKLDCSFDQTNLINFFGSRGIAPTFLKLDSWSPGADFIPILSTILSDKERKIVRKKLSFMHTKRFYTCFKKRRVQFRVGAIPRLPFFIFFMSNMFVTFYKTLGGIPSFYVH